MHVGRRLVTNNNSVGYRIRSRSERVDDDVVLGLAGIETAFVGDAMNKFNSMTARVRPVIPGMRLAGRALTVRPALGDNLAVYMAIERLEPGDVLVIESRGLSAVAQWGDLTSAAARHRGAAGAVMDGSVRDRAGIERVGFPVFALPEPVAAGGTRVGPGELNVPVAVGGIAVCPGDVVLGDDSGVVVVPAEAAAAVLAAARHLADADADKMRGAEQGNATSAWMADAMRRAGYGD